MYTSAGAGAGVVGAGTRAGIDAGTGADTGTGAGDVAVPSVFALSDFGDYLDLSRFQFTLSAVSDGLLALATPSYLILTDEIVMGVGMGGGGGMGQGMGGGMGRGMGGGGNGDGEEGIRIALEFSADAGAAICMEWVSADVLGVGFGSGLVVLFDTQGREVVSFRTHGSAVMSLRVGAVGGVLGGGVGLWLLHEGGMLVSVSYGV
ncbi:hypothetical protein B484DRAFT_414671 [Ochromonadaceae sp. CCMP2298]|nr:hypothetical protein B484DRAFT_414671 [Ochromonadaceae sp. CCMP2298]